MPADLDELIRQQKRGYRLNPSRLFEIKTVIGRRYVIVNSCSNPLVTAGHVASTISSKSAWYEAAFE